MTAAAGTGLWIVGEVDVAAATQFVVDHLVLVILVLTRLSTLLMAMPAVGVGVPRRVRALLAILITFLLIPPIADQTPSESLPQFDQWIDLTIAMAREAIVGMLIGATVQLIVTGFQTGGEIMTGTGGMQLGDAIDPTTSSSMPATARLIGLMVTAILLAVGGHRLMLTLFLDSFESMPAGAVVLGRGMLDLVVTQLAGGMAAGVRIAAPVVAALLLSNLVTGLISRTLPQINVLAVGLPINALSLLVVLSLTIGSIGLVFQSELSIALERVADLFAAEVAGVLPGSESSGEDLGGGAI